MPPLRKPEALRALLTRLDAPERAAFADAERCVAGPR